jgi:hypothetical protein
MDVNSLASSLLTGSLIQFFPSVLKGAMSEYLGRIPIKDFCGYVQRNENLWSKFTGNYKDLLIQYGPKLGNLNWFTAEWVMESGRKSSPALYSLLTGWPEGQEWLRRQVDDIKLAIEREVLNGARQNTVPGNPPDMPRLRERQETGTDGDSTA